MSQITIQCRLFADEPARKYLWELMAERNTPLVNELLNAIAHHQDFPTWRSRGKLPNSEVTKLAKSLKTDPRFSGQPAKFVISAEKTATYTFKSWVAIQQRNQQRLEGKISWLRMLRTDEELAIDCDRDLAAIKGKAQQIISRTGSAVDDAEAKQDFRKQLYRDYDKAKDTLTQSAIAYLLKNHCQMPTEGEEDTAKLLKYRRKIENQIHRLTQQLENRLPQGRDLTGERWLHTLKTSTEFDPRDNAEASRWQSQLLKKVDNVPFPIVSKPLYSGRTDIIVAIGMGLDSAVTAAVVDVTTQRVLVYRSIKQLLGDDYRLLNRQRDRQTQQRHFNHIAQRQGLSRQASNSELGEYVDRLLAKAIVELARSYGAGSIALPKLEHIRASIQSELDARAQQKIPGYIEGQKQYIKKLSINLHNWSHNRLSQAIVNKAARVGISIEYGTQLARASPNARAIEIALTAYENRTS
jgi:transposase